MFQEVSMIGRLGKTPEMRYTPNGKEVATLNVATSRKWTGTDGQINETTIWFEVTVWGRLAVSSCEYLTKGKLIFAKGPLEVPQTWIDRDGNPQVTMRATANQVLFLSPRDDGGAPSRVPLDGSTGVDSPGSDESYGEDDIPF